MGNQVAFCSKFVISSPQSNSTLNSDNTPANRVVFVYVFGNISHFNVSVGCRLLAQ